ncbi:hypothetical protein [Synechococcus sp. PCC 7335]|nr:hypothetical protein [Synechococcus sp. PCC 7335]
MNATYIALQPQPPPGLAGSTELIDQLLEEFSPIISHVFCCDF